MSEIHIYLLFFIIISIIFTRAAPADDRAKRVKQFDLPKSAPRARIISLSNSLNKINGNKDFLRDKADPFDNFKAFDRVDEDDAVPKDHQATRNRKGGKQNIGVFFPEDEIPERS